MNTKLEEMEIITLYNNENQSSPVYLNLNTIFANKGKYILGSVQQAFSSKYVTVDRTYEFDTLIYKFDPTRLNDTSCGSCMFNV